MFKIESYVTPILLSYVDKYVRDFNPANAQVSLWGGGVALHNLVLKPDVLQREVALPFTLISGRIHELLIQVPWTKIMSEPIVVTIDTIECVLNLKPPESPDESPPPPPARKTQVVEAPPGYMQALVRRIVSNIALKVHHLIVKYVQDDIVLSLNVKHLSIDSAGVNWEPSFADIDQYQPTVRRIVKLDDLTLCLDKADSDGKIRYYQEPLLYRCHLDLRVLTQLVSANCRRASSLNVTLRSTKLAFSVTSDQLTLLLRLMKERVPEDPAQQPAVSKSSLSSQTELPIATKTNSAESSRSNNSWSEWAWSWLPTWMDKEGGIEDIPVSPTPLPIYLDAFLDDLSVVFKVMEVVDGLNRKRSRSVIEVGASHAVVKSSLCYPTSMSLRFGARDLLLRSHGKCVCGVANYDASIDQATKYLKKIDVEEPEGPWTWPKEVLSEPSITSYKVEEAQAVSEEFRPTPEGVPNSNAEITDQPPPSNHNRAEEPQETAEDYDLFSKMRPLIYVEFLHERTPPLPYMNPYDNPPKDFQYSDWVEECRVKVKLEPIELRLCMGLVHRLMAIRSIFKEVEAPDMEFVTRVLTVEECEALMDNLPERRITFEARGLRFRFYPWNHFVTSKPIKSPVVLGLELPNVCVTITAPLYPHRVCSAACQIPEDVGPLWQGARAHINAVIKEAQMLLTTLDNSLQKPCARAEIHLVVHILLKKSYFEKKESVHMSFLMKIRELNISGSWARLQAAYCAMESLVKDKASVLLRHSSLAKDALHDEEAVLLDFTLEEFIARGYITKNIRTFIVSIQSAKATAFHEPEPGDVKQAWLFSAPDAPSTTPYLRMAFQWCDVPGPNYFDYLGFWAEPTAVSIDPLLIAWLAYEPVMKPVDLASASLSNIPKGSSQYFVKRKLSWSGGAGGRGNKSGSSAELVHVRPRMSADSSSEPSEKKQTRSAMPAKNWWQGENLLPVHQRLKAMLIHVEMGLIQVYITTSTVSAVDCVTLRDAMERHAIEAHGVLAISLGRIAMHSNSANKHLWQELRHDGPTFINQKYEKESFPWKIRIADVSCYTLEAARIERDHSGSALRSKLKAQAGFALPRTVLELITTTITVSVVTKMLQIKNIQLIPEPRADTSATTQTERAKKTKYFSGGLEFKPTTLKEFFRGPQRRSQRDENKIAGESKSENTSHPQSDFREKVTVREGPVVSLGVHLHADTPPIIIKLERDQVLHTSVLPDVSTRLHWPWSQAEEIHSVAAAIHGFRHISMLMKKDRDEDVEEVKGSQYHMLGGQSSSHRSFIPRSVSEQDHVQTLSEDSPSKSSELIEIFDREQEAPKKRLTTFLMCQWVVSHATVVVSSGTVKLAFDMDDIISTLDIQPHYNQLKIKVASAAIRHYEFNEDEEWVPGVLGGRVLEARETTGGKDEDQFLAVTITQAHISQLPDSWKQELHPKLLEKKDGDDVMWEIYATLAPLEAIIQPVILDNVVTLAKEIMPRAYCPMKVGLQKKSPTIHWPFCYLAAGGMRVLITAALQDVDTDEDDTFVFTIDKVSINPHPDNPICRRVVNTGDSGWLGTATNYEGRQYEITVKTIELRSARFKQLLEEETVDKDKNNSNPALKWNQSVEEVTLTPLLYPMDVCLVLAPPLFTRDLLTCGPAVEVNIITDCVIEVSVEQFVLSKNLYAEMHAGLAERESKVELFFDRGRSSVCPYAELLKIRKVASSDSDNTIHTQEDADLVVDSGVETIASQSTTSKFKTSFADDVPLKKSVSIAFSDLSSQPSDNLEVFMTMGTLELSLYVKDDDSPELKSLRIPLTHNKPVVSQPPQVTPSQVKKTPSKADIDEQSTGSSRSMTEDIRPEKEAAKIELKHFKNKKDKMSEGSLPLVHATLQQPNLYYWKRRDAKNLQVSLFDVHAGLGVGPVEGHWNAILLSTAKGLPDPVTDIPPALATLKIVAPNTSSQYSSATGHKGTVQLDIERPIQIEICADSFKRIMSIYSLIMDKVFEEDDFDFMRKKRHDHAASYKIQQFLVQENIESITVHTSQMALSGSEGSFGWSGMSCQIGVGVRPPRVTARTLVSALVIASGPSTEQRHVLLQPLMLGSEIDATWEAWRRAEGGPSSLYPTVSVSVEMGRVVLDLRPEEINTFNKLNKSLDEVLLYSKELRSSSQLSSNKQRSVLSRSSSRHSSNSSDTDSNNHYYQDDLRSGAFKILTGGQLPMAYQIMLRGNAVSWRYPHPRAITRIIAFPLPGADKETECVLELFIAILGVWEPHTYFKIPVGEPREIHLQCRPPDAVFSTMWRFRTCGRPEPRSEPYEFQAEKFIPRHNPLVITVMDEETPKTVEGVTAEQLSGVLRVDSYFAPQVLPRIKFVVRVADTEVHLHNSIPSFTSQATAMEGYYVSRPLMRSHRVLSFFGRNSKYHVRLGAPAGTLIVVNTALSADVLDCATGTMEELVSDFLLQAAVTGGMGLNPRMRITASTVEVGLYVSRLRTLQALSLNWSEAVSEYLNEDKSSSDLISIEERSPQELAVEATLALEGRVSLWIHNSCSSALRIGQEGTDEVVPLGPGVRLAYRWRCPTSPKRLRLALADPTAHWHWSGSLSFKPGSTRVRLEDPTSEEKEISSRGLGIYVHVKVEETGGNKYMHLCGRLSLANMLRLRLLYKVRARTNEAGQWRTMCSDEMEAEHVGRSVLCATDAEMVLKIKFVNHDTGWSGDIPLKECPKENVPWLVKVPSEGEMQYISVWCRVVRARSDGRIIATVWPLYVLHSHLPLDTDVLIVTEKSRPQASTQTEEQPPPLIQSTPGRGNCTHLLTPGTTANKHTLSFQYRNIQCPVTREAVPLHYGVTDVSVFDKRTPVMHIDEVIQDIRAWLKRAGRTFPSTWPYSLVSKHHTGTWQAALMQPRCDVTIRYQAIRAGGGCSLEVQLCPVVLLCNAAPLALTLRAHDAAPLCVLKSGTAISPPSAILTKPFFMSVEIGRETFVSEQLQVSSKEPGRYGKLPAGHVSLDHAAEFSVLCNQKVALLTMYYEIKQEINVFGITSSYVIINRLNIDLQVSAIAVPSSIEEVHNLQANSFKVVKPTKPGSINGTALCRFYLRGRWRGGNPSELHKFLCLALSSDNYTGNATVPVRLGVPPIRRAIGLINEHQVSIPVTVSQIPHDSRCLIVVAHDTCPQFLVHNLTHVPISVAQPSPTTQEQPSTSKVVLSEECPGAHWWCVVPPLVALHYSTPAFCLRYPPQPPPAPQTVAPAITVLSFGKLIEDSLRSYHEWSAPVAITSGEHLLQFYGGVTIKLCVETHPHSTLLMLKETDERDLSASDIRRRLFGAVGSSPSLLDLHMPRTTEDKRRSLERVNAVSRLFEAPKEYNIPDYTKDKTDGADKTKKPLTPATVFETGLTDIRPKTSPSEPPTENPAGSQDTSLKELKQSPGTSGGSAGPSQTGSKEKVRQLSSATLPERQEESFSLRSGEMKTEDTASLQPLKVPTSSEDAKMMETQEDSSAKIKERDSSITTNPDIEDKRPESSNVVAFAEPGTSTNRESEFKLRRRRRSPKTAVRSDINLSRAELAFHSKQPVEMDCSTLAESESLRCVVSGLVIKMAANAGEPALIALHMDRSAVLIINDEEKTRLIVAVANVQIDNLQYETGQYDFAVVATTRPSPLVADPWPALWNMFADKAAFSTKCKEASVMIKVHVDKWNVVSHYHKEITELEILLGSLALYLEDAYVSSILDLSRLAIPTVNANTDQIPEERSLQRPLRLKLLYIHPLNLTLTLHTAVRMYIALDQSPLRLSAFKLHDMMTSAERLTHALTVHYLSAAILGAGWVVGGLELLGAPGAIAARLGEATGGVKGVASATAAALLRSLSAWAGSLARNLDLLAGDEEHARRAAAARRRLPTNFIAGIVAGVTNFAINILGAVGGLAHHPLVGVAVGETDSSTAALRRGLLGALTKPLSATADLVAYAGHGLLRQTGWDPVLQPRNRRRTEETRETAGWRRDCVRWTFRLAELHALSGFEVMLDNSPLQLLITHKYLVVADPVTERIVEMIDLKSCTLAPYHGQIVELSVAHSRKSASKTAEGRAPDEDDEYQISAAAMARVARYTGAEGAPSQSEVRILSLLTQPGRDHSLYAILATVLHQDPETHLAIL